ncbi:MAG TPA: amino acid adenylation domain-containing protein [Actinomycetota bacterium]|nr:amino acid adenylation domain-containing protein [Actinomycetota bacterium]
MPQVRGPRLSSVVELIERAAGDRPGAVAVTDGSTEITYAQLWEMSSAAAATLIERGAGPEVPIGVIADRNPVTIAAFLSVLRAGSAFVPIDPALPPERLEYILEALGSPMLVGHRGLQTPRGGALIIEDLVDGGSARPLATPHPRSSAYIIFTSGSTGSPKGVAVEHRSLGSFCNEVVRLFEMTPGDRMLQFASPSFDASIEEIFPTLACGATVVMREARLWSPSELSRRCDDLGVTIIDLPTAYWHEMVTAQIETGEAAIPPGVRLVIIGGEAADAGRLQQWLESPAGKARLLNTYGPTEATVTATFWEAGDAASLTKVPIGAALENASAHVLKESFDSAAPNEEGELFIGGSGVARGYIGNPAATAAAFLPDPFSKTPGARMYRTGDMATVIGEGAIEFLGRRDFQVKIRGYRVETAEVETAIRRFPGVGDAAVVTTPGPSAPRLIAYVTPKSIEQDDLTAFLNQSLPAYMIPSAFVTMEELPYTQSRKIDRRALPVPAVKGSGGRKLTSGEEDLARLWESVLQASEISPDDSFFELGGDSLLATRLSTRIRSQLKRDLSLREIFDHPQLSAMADAMTKAPLAAELESLVPSPDTDQSTSVLSLEQERLWFFDQFEPGSSDYVIPCFARIRGAIDVEALRLALGDLVTRHDAFRSSFTAVSGRPVQRVAAEAPLALDVVDLSPLPPADRERKLEGLKAQEAVQPFDLSAAPLVRCTLVVMGEDDHALFLSMHHIVSDGWSLSIVARDLGTAYAGRLRGDPAPLAPQEVPYSSFARWQREWVDSPSAGRQIEHFRERLKGAPGLLELPLDHPRPTVQTFRGSRFDFTLGPSTFEMVSERARDGESTPFMVLLSAFGLVAGRYGRAERVLVGSPIAGRNRQELEDVVGFFVNTLVLDVDLTGNPTFADLLSRVREAALGGFANQEVPFEKLVSELHPERDPSRSPLVQIMFVMQNTAPVLLELQGAGPAVVEAPTNAVPVDVTLEVTEAEGVYRCSLLYNSDLFEGETMSRFASHFQHLLDEALAGPTQRISALPLLTELEERSLYYELNGSVPEYPRDETIHGWFEKVAAQHAGKMAVVSGSRSMTYGELRERAGSVATEILKAGSAGDKPVGVFLDRGVDLIVATLGVLMAGSAYLPLDPEYPMERLSFMLQDTGTTVVLTDRAGAAQLPEDVSKVLMEEVPPQDMADQSPRATSAAAPACVMFTSGSTGVPKGIVIPHRAVLRLVVNTNYLSLGPDDVITQSSNFSFDASVFELWGALLNGARLVVIDKQTLLSPQALSQSVRDNAVTVAFFTTAYFNHLAASDPSVFSSIDSVIIGGEVADPAGVAKVLAGSPPRRLVNGYGPTENTTFSTWHEVEEVSEGKAIPIGRPVSGSTVFILDSNLEPLPRGVIGEICLGGDGLAVGYLNRPDLTREKFVLTRYGRLYRSGDLGRINNKGEIEFVGRIDEQLKIRGFRIEPGEVEAAITSHEAIDEAVVLALEERPGDKTLVAYYSGASPPGAPDLKTFLSSKLPQFMVPQALMALERLPLNPNGKVDRAALPKLDSTAAAYRPPETEIEATVASIWEQVLEKSPIGLDDSFFELGGHSLLATQVISRIHETMHVEIPLKSIFEEPTVSRLAAVVEKKAAAGLTPPEMIPRLPRGPRP